MVHVILFIASFFILLPSSCRPDLQCGQSTPCNKGFVINGSPTCSSEFPWFASLIKPSLVPGQDQLSPFCGASIITAKFLLSAGHCFKYYPGDKVLNPAEVRVYIGFDDRSVLSPPYKFVKRIQIHEDWLANTGKFEYGNDLAMIEIVGAIDFSGTVSSICLPSPDMLNLVEIGKDVKMCGFGKIERGEKVTIPTLLQKGEYIICDCKSSINNTCANEVTSFTCHGDSGSGLVGLSDGSFFLVGVVSWGRKCGGTGFTTRYVDVFRHLDWIDSNLCRTEKQNLCILPFKFRQKKYTECATIDIKSNSTCPTRVDANGEGEGWEFCSSQCPGFKQPVNGGVGAWSEWSQCSQSCEGGSKTRDRDCNNPVAMHGGEECTEDVYFQKEDCNMEDCPIEDTTSVMKPGSGFQCEEDGEQCFNIDWLRSQKKCQQYVTIYDQDDTSQADFIYNKTCRIIPFGLCCVGSNPKLKASQHLVLTGGVADHDSNFLAISELISADGVCRNDIPDLPVPISGHGSIYFNNHLLICGGASATNYLSSCYKLTNSSSIWTQAATLNIKRTDATLTKVEQELFVLGGWSGHHLDSIEKYAGSEWQLLSQTMPIPRYGHCTVYLTSKKSLVVIGGLTEGPDSPSTSKVEMLNILTWTWTTLEPLPNFLYYHRCVVLQEGGEENIYVTGTNTEVWKFSRGTWSQSGDLVEARTGHGMGILDGRPIVVGGYGHGENLVSLEIMDSDGNWKKIPSSLSMGRQDLSLTEVPAEAFPCLT